MYSYLRELWAEKPEELRRLMKERMIRWRKEPAVVRVDKPLRLDKARGLGYRDKKGFVVLRVRVRKGGFAKPRPRSGRRQKALGVVKHKVNVSLKDEALGRAWRNYRNLYPLGAYWLASDGRYSWYEVIMVDPYHPSIISDKQIQLPNTLLRRREKRLKKREKG